MAKKRKFRPLIRCGCPTIGEDRSTTKSFADCTCAIVSPKTSARGRYLSPGGKYIVTITSAKDPMWLGQKPFKKAKING